MERDLFGRLIGQRDIANFLAQLGRVDVGRQGGLTDKSGHESSQNHERKQTHTVLQERTTPQTSGPVRQALVFRREMPVSLDASRRATAIPGWHAHKMAQ